MSPSSRPARPTSRLRSSATQPATRDPATDAQQLVDAIAEACRAFSDILENEHPLLFLLMVSQVFSAYDARTLGNPHRIDLTDRLSSYAESDEPAFRALGYGMSRMIGRDYERRAFDEGHDHAIAEMPEWLRRLDDTKITGCWRGYDVEDLDDVLGVGIRFTDGREGTLVLITGSRSHEIVETFLSTEPYAETALEWATHDPRAAGLSKISKISASDILEEALECSDPTDPGKPDNHAGWTAARGLIEWAMSLLSTELGLESSVGSVSSH